MTASPNVIELGKIPFGKDVSFFYTIRNNFNHSVNITNIIEGCKSCTSTKINKSTLGPKSQTELHVTFSPGSLGRTVKGISILYNNPITKIEEELKVIFISYIHE